MDIYINARKFFIFFSDSTLSYYGRRKYRMKMISKGFIRILKGKFKHFYSKICCIFSFFVSSFLHVNARGTYVPSLVVIFQFSRIMRKSRKYRLCASTVFRQTSVLLRGMILSSAQLND